MRELIGTKVIKKNGINLKNGTGKTKRVQQNRTIEWLVKQREYGRLL